MTTRVPSTIDEYIAGFSPEVRSILKKVRSTIRKAAPGARERISYRIPAFDLQGNLIYFAAFKKHFGLFPPVKGDAKLRRQLAPYRGAKGNLRFPVDEPVPYALIGRVVKFRVKEHLQAVASRRRKKY